MIDFLKYQKVCFFFSLCLVALGAYSFVVNKGFAYNIDFTGGTELRVAFNSTIDIAKIREALNNQDWQDVVVQNVSNSNEFVIRLSDHTEELESKVRSVLDQAFGQGSYVVRSVDKVGGEAGADVRFNAIMSVIIAILALAIYISLRNQYAYALGAIAALVHDILILLVYYLVFREPISLNVLAGILAVLGYSLNDTIIVFGRIKDNLGLLKKNTPEQVVNISINQTLTRTLLTSISTFIAVFSLYWFGGEVLRSCSITIILGVVFGTYSSVYIASAVMLLFNKELKQNKSVA